MCNGSSTQGVSVGDTDCDNPTFAILQNYGVLCQSLAGSHVESRTIDFLEPESLDQAILYSVAAKNADEQSTRTLQPQEITGDSAHTAADLGRQHGHPGSGLGVWRHQLRSGFKSFWQQKSH